MIRNVTVAIGILASWITAAVASDTPAVQFDVTGSVAFVDSTSDEFAATNPGEKTVIAELVVSLFVPPHVDVTHALYHFYIPEGPARVIDYAPRTRTTSDIVGPIDVSKNTENGQHVSLGGAAQLDSWLKADASAGHNQSIGTNERFKMQPPVATILAAGTSNRERGVYFKLQKTTTETLEGEQRIEIELRVPEYWRGGYMRLFAQASSAKQAFPAVSFLVPIYLQGDRDAQQTAEQLLAFERRFLIAAEQSFDAIQRAGRPTVAHEFSLRSPEIPDDWQDQLLWRTTTMRAGAFFQRLPPAVQSAAADYHTAKRLAIALGQRSERAAAPTSQQITSLKPPS